MSVEYLKYDRYGNSDQIKFIIGQVLRCNVPIPYRDVRELCLTKSAKFGETLPGIIGLLHLTSLLDKDENDLIILRCDIHDMNNYIHNDHQFCLEFIRRILQKIHSLNLLSNIFPSGSITFEVESIHYVIKENYIPTTYSGIKKLLIDYGMLDYDTNSRTTLILNREFRDLFESEVINKINKKTSHKMSEKRSFRLSKAQKIAAFALTIVSIIGGIYAIFKPNEISIPSTAEIGDVNITGDNNSINVNSSIKQERTNSSTESNLNFGKYVNKKNGLSIGQVFRDTLTSATLGVSFIGAMNTADVVLNLPGQDQIEASLKAPGSSWSFEYKKRRYKIYLCEINYSARKFGVEVIEID